MRLSVIAVVVVVVVLSALPAGAGFGQRVVASTNSGPPGSVVSITHASDVLSGGSERCALPITLTIVPATDVQTADLSGGEPFTPPGGTFTVPHVPEGDYSVVEVCGGDTGMDAFPFHVTRLPVLAAPNFAG